MPGEPNVNLLEKFGTLLQNAAENIPKHRKKILLNKAEKFISALQPVMSHEEVFYALAAMSLIECDNYMDEVRAHIGAKIIKDTVG